ncbi:TATA box-binding protein-like protein 2 [Ranunculus cassubicifolius]
MGQGTPGGLGKQGLPGDRNDGDKKEKKFEPVVPPSRDYLLMEEEFVSNQERLKPQEDKNEEDRSKVDDLRGSPMSVGNLEELIDENHAIVSSSVGPEYYVGILSFVDKDQLEPGCSILMNNKVCIFEIEN